MTAVTKVAIAVVQSDGHVLVGIRGDDGPLAGKSEFPGGKCLSDETPRSCAVRECREETGLIVVPREHLTTVTHTYDHGTVELHFWQCDLNNDIPDRAQPRQPFKWVPTADLPNLDFPEANAAVLSRLAETEA